MCYYVGICRMKTVNSPYIRCYNMGNTSYYNIKKDEVSLA